MSMTFTDTGVGRPLCEALRQQGLVTPTPVQEEAIPVLLEGDDIMAQAQTGTGKTLAFALPMLQRLERDNPHVQALIVAPTRELALQISTELAKLAPVVGASVLAAYGGQDVEAQIRKLRHAPSIVVGTPGRLLDHVRRGTVDFSRVSMLVLDEADQMLHMGFLPEVETLIRTTPVDRQTMLFSATIPDSIRKLAARYMRNPRDIRIASEQVTVDKTRQLVIDTTDRGKLQTLVRLIGIYQPYLAVVFCRTKIRAKKLNEELIAHGLESDELHGDLTQAKREQVMQRFRDAKLQILVATDVAARGIDVEGVTHVINYDIPHDAESYIHRIGRTGRAGQAGFAITLAAPRDRRYLELIEDGIGMGLPRRSDRDLESGEPLETAAREPRRTSAARGGGRQDTARREGSRDRSGAGDRGGVRNGSLAGARGKGRTGKDVGGTGRSGRNAERGRGRNASAGTLSGEGRGFQSPGAEEGSETRDRGETPAFRPSRSGGTGKPAGRGTRGGGEAIAERHSRSGNDGYGKPDGRGTRGGGEAIAERHSRSGNAEAKAARGEHKARAGTDVRQAWRQPEEDRGARRRDGGAPSTRRSQESRGAAGPGAKPRTVRTGDRTERAERNVPPAARNGQTKTGTNARKAGGKGQAAPASKRGGFGGGSASPFSKRTSSKSGPRNGGRR